MRIWAVGAAGAAALVVALVAVAVGGSGQPTAEPRVDVSTPIARRSVELTLDTRDVRAGTFRPPVPVVDGLGPVATRLVRVMTSTAVLLRQCVLGQDDRALSCAPALAAQPHEWDDQLETLVELVASFPRTGAGPADCRLQRCALIVTADDGDLLEPPVLARAELVFGAEERPGSIRLAGGGSFTGGDVVPLTLTGFRPGQVVTLGWCAPPGPVAPEACGAPAPVVEVVVGANGQVGAELRVPDDGIGPGDHRCGARHPCAVAVTGIGRAATVAIAPVTFQGAPGPDLSGGRLATGLGLAIALLTTAVVLRVRSDPRNAGDDPFRGVDLAVPEWDSISFDDPETL